MERDPVHELPGRSAHLQRRTRHYPFDDCPVLISQQRVLLLQDGGKPALAGRINIKKTAKRIQVFPCPSGDVRLHIIEIRSKKHVDFMLGFGHSIPRVPVTGCSGREEFLHSLSNGATGEIEPAENGF